jgi:hypothetical protein
MGTVNVASRGTNKMIGFHPETGHDSLVSELSRSCHISEEKAPNSSAVELCDGQ